MKFKSSLIEKVVGQAERRDAKTRVAIEDAETSLSWREFIDLAETIGEEVGKNTDEPARVMVQTGRSSLFPAAILGCRMAGRIYVPLDAGVPTARREMIAEDASADLLITDNPVDGDWSRVATISGAHLYRRVTNWNSRTKVPKDTAYVVYTSGSTGKPKGCVIREGGLEDMLNAISRQLVLGSDDRWSCVHSFSFDVSVYEIWAALTVGGTVVISSESSRRDPAALVAQLAENQATVVSLTPSLLGLLIDELQESGPLYPSIRHFLLAGESARLKDVEWLLNSGVAPEAKVWNLWGISEGTVHCTLGELNLQNIAEGVGPGTPIGWPLSHLEITLLSESDGLVGPSGSGEMIVEGSGIAWGYLNRPELTDEKFELNPETGLMRYRTGDWAERRNGELYYLGRKDNQVKIRGHRVELNEIEHVLETLEGVDEAVCLAMPGFSGNLGLSCVVRARDQRVNAISLRRQLRQLLPAFMIPEYVLIVDSFALTSNGKLDRSFVRGLLEDHRSHHGGSQ